MHQKFPFSPKGPFLEAADRDGEIFGFERMTEAIRQARIERISAERAIERFFAEVDAFSGGRFQEDDQTMVVLRAADTVPVGDVSSVG